MKEKITFQGRSLVINALLVALNLTGLTFIVLGYHVNFEEQSTLFKSLGMMMLILSIGGIVLFRGRYMMASVARVLVGGLFIVSGLVKANDPLGFAYKLEEYFEDGALAYRIKEWFGMPGFSMEVFMDYALLLSILICIAEIVLGVLTIIGGKIKLVSYLMLLMMLFFTFLTWHTASCDPTVRFVDHDTYSMSDPVAAMKLEEVKTSETMKIISQTETTLVIEEQKLPQCVDDCGCFGDAMKGSVGRSLTPQESLWKDLILLYLVVWIFAAQWIIAPNTRKENLAFGLASVAMIVFFSWIFSWYFPVLFGITSILGALWILRVGGKFFGNYLGVALIVTAFSVLTVSYVLMYMPLKDYRAYAVGSNLLEKMNDGIEGEYESMLVYRNKNTGEKVEYSSTSEAYTSSKIWEKKEWVYESMVQKAIVPTKIPSITDQFNPFVNVEDVSDYERNMPYIQSQLAASKIQVLKLWDLVYETSLDVPVNEYSVEEYNPESFQITDTVEVMDPSVSDISIRDFIVAADQIVMVSSKNLNQGDWRYIEELKSIAESCRKQEVPFVVICGASREEINAFREKHDFHVPFFVNDETELKAIARSNPSLFVIEKAVVKAKYPFRLTPSKEKFSKTHLK